MKELTSYNRTAQYLTKVFKLINAEYFDDSLEMPTITIQSTVGAYGHVTTSKIWKNSKGVASYELNLGADYLNRPIENIVATLIHEGCHLYAMQNNIKDTSNHGVYHNKRFKELAEERGLMIDRHPKYGWTITEPSEDTIDFCIRNDLQEILITRNEGFHFIPVGGNSSGSGVSDGTPVPVRKKSNSRKYVCPVCGNIARTTRDMNLICGDCMEHMIIEN